MGSVAAAGAMTSDSRGPNGTLPSAEAPLRSIHTSNFPTLLQQTGISLLVTTYQAGKLVVIRSKGGSLQTHFRNFDKPMGLAVNQHRLAIGTALEIWEYDNVPAVTRKLDPSGELDACFLPRLGQTTGDIEIHEMAWGSGSPADLWFINTRFSCLCTLDRWHSFVPVWRPPFISKLAPEDRCHLNGLCMVPVPGEATASSPGFVTALGETDAPDGWRANKKDGGILIELATGRIILRGLSMPHSPRWHQGKLWLLESGKGGIGWIDPWSHHYVSLAKLPGFTRGLDFFGDLAFIGLSQVRESAVFSGIPIAQRSEERACGVWVLDINTGQTVAFVKFEDAVQEIFAVQVLAGSRCPDVINDDPALIANSYVLPDADLDAVPDDLRSPYRPAGINPAARSAI